MPDADTQPRATIIIPAVNEEASLPGVLADLAGAGQHYQVIVVDDGSTDRTRAVAEEAGATVVSHEIRKGYGAALKTGVGRAHAERLVFLDADGQHDAADVERLLEHLDEFDMVVGDRFASGQQPRDGIGKRLFAVLSNWIAGSKIPDVNCGLRAVNKGVLRKYLHLMPSGYSFSTTSTLAFLKSDRPVKFVPIGVKPRAPQSCRRQPHLMLGPILCVI